MENENEKRTPMNGSVITASSTATASSSIGAPASGASASVAHWSSSGSRLSGITGSGTTVRSRVTVVCAECKKQKLKCDRQSPCDSCKKRNTVDRCIYSPGAIEKVDITSVNNRLKAVENSLSQNLNLNPTNPPPTFFAHPPPGLQPPQTGLGQQPFPYAPYNTQASLPPNDLNPPQLRPMRLLSRNRRGATAAPPIDGVPALWLREVSAESGHDTQLKAATYAIDDQNAFGQFVFGVEPLDRREFYHKRSMEAPTHHSPAQLASYLAGLENLPDEPLNPVNPPTETHSDLYEPVIGHLLEKFPSRPLRREMLRRFAVNATAGVRCAVPFNAMKARIEDVCTASPCSDPEMCRNDKGKGCMPLFSSIAEAAAALALGSLMWSSDAFPYATAKFGSDESQQGALPDKPPTSKEAHSLFRTAQFALSMHSSRHGFAAFDTSFIHAKILCVQYLLLEYSIRGEAVHGQLSPEVPSLVGGLVWEARIMGLGIDPDYFDPPGSQQRMASEGHLYAFEGSATGAQTLRPGNENSRIKRESESNDEGGTLWKKRPMPIFEKEVRRRLWYSIVWLDFLTADSFGYNTVIKAEEYTTRLPSNCDDTHFYPDSPRLPLPSESSPERNNSFYLAKLRLLAVSFKAGAFFIRTGSLSNQDEAENKVMIQQLSDELLQVLNSVPEKYRFTEDNEDILSTRSSSPPPMTALLPPHAQHTERLRDEYASLLAQRCDLMITAYYTIMRLFVPKINLARVTNPTSRTPWSFDDSFDMTGPHISNLRAVRPALLVIHVAKVQMRYASHAPPGTFHMMLFSRRVFDAAVVLAFVAIQQPVYTAPVVLDAVRSALAMLRDLIPDPVITHSGSPIRNEVMWVLETMLSRAEIARDQGSGLQKGDSGTKKRKHGDVVTENKAYQHDFRYPFVGSGLVTMGEDLRDVAELEMDRDYEAVTLPMAMSYSDSSHSGSHTRLSSNAAGPSNVHSERNPPSLSSIASSRVGLSSGPSSTDPSPPHSRHMPVYPTPNAANTQGSSTLRSHGASPVPRHDAPSRPNDTVMMQSPEQIRYGLTSIARPMNHVVQDSVYGVSSPLYAPPLHMPMTQMAAALGPSSAPPSSSYEGSVLSSRPSTSMSNYIQGIPDVSAQSPISPGVGPPAQFSGGSGLINPMHFLQIGQRPQMSLHGPDTPTGQSALDQGMMLQGQWPPGPPPPMNQHPQQHPQQHSHSQQPPPGTGSQWSGVGPPYQQWQPPHF